MRFSSEWICAKFGAKITHLTQDIEPICPPKEIFSKTWEQNIDTEHVSGHRTIVRIQTDKGLEIEMSYVKQVYYDDMVDKLTWIIDGEPSFKTEVVPLHTVELCCAAAVNRIHHVMKARPGYVSTCEMGNII